MANIEKIQAAVEIFKSSFPGVHGKFRFAPSERSAGEVDVLSEDGLYCTINVRSRTVKGI